MVSRSLTRLVLQLPDPVYQVQNGETLNDRGGQKQQDGDHFRAPLSSWVEPISSDSVVQPLCGRNPVTLPVNGR